MSYIYIAGPLSHPNPAVVHARARVHEEAAVWMRKMGLTVYSPIASWYHLSRIYDMGTTASEWETENRNMLKGASLIRLIDMPGLEESVGTNMERAWAKEFDIREQLYDPRGLGVYKYFEKTLCA